MPKQHRGFAVMTPAKRREIAKLGGEAARDKGVAHRWTSETAREAGSRGGKAVHALQIDKAIPPSAT